MNKSVTGLELSGQSPGLNSTEHLWRAQRRQLKDTSHPFSLRFKGYVKKTGDKLLKSRCAKPVEIYPRGLKLWFVPKTASTKYQIKGLNSFVRERFKFW